MSAGTRRGRRSVQVTVNCFADHYAGPGETIIEFVTADGKLGGLIGFWYDADAGTLAVQPYRLDAGVTVRTAAAPDGMVTIAGTPGPSTREATS